MRSNFLFIGGQHHGSVLPVWSDSVAAAAVSVEAELRAGPGKRIYAGYFPWHMSLRGGGLRQLAVHSSVRHGGRFWEEVADALSIALDDCQRVLESVRDRHRPVPLNETLDDEPGVPGKRRHCSADADALGQH